ncbi:hypothetical protein UFOVP4_1 [uncultured Caudovirales phage]|uniref:Uncharacterized protein n=1 Tax=uncultured Caudovirales phage TaxID=2100421 RepID=A0A6J5T960_9CAUD|nr:hypothetical protein UFOVP4_1 [uncultured Caudovirales phage]CAB4241366.1 hypothetical protein UFOVP64_58 [uncultured Caudovirales phage]CAB5078973.1 hypothetical protein UFOVP145_14 [uncultured Caudovirales phage]
MLSGYKTYVTGGLAILGALAAYFTKEASLLDAAQIIVPAVIGMTVRHGISRL